MVYSKIKQANLFILTQKIDSTRIIKKLFAKQNGKEEGEMK